MACLWRALSTPSGLGTKPVPSSSASKSHVSTCPFTSHRTIAQILPSFECLVASRGAIRPRLVPPYVVSVPGTFYSIRHFSNACSVPAYRAVCMACIGSTMWSSKGCRR
eukprot:3426852-Rhodomonas_salina.4